MGLKIMLTGLEQYAPGGNSRVKVMLIGGPGVGKTRSASYWPKPIYADCEGGLASVADRNVPFVSIQKSQDMLDFLDFLKAESRKPEKDRQFQTVVIDTLDAFQRKVKDEWLQAHPGSQSFSGFDAWGFLDAKMQMLMTRLLNLDMNVYVAVHYSDKTITEGSGENAKQRQEYQLQLSGAIKDQVFNDFDLVGWMGTYYEAVEGQRVQKRGMTFKPTPDKPFLKDRLNVTPTWLDITFSDDDYINLWAGMVSRLDEFKETKEVGEIPAAGQEVPSGVVSPADVGEAALPAVDPREVPLSQWDKPTLAKMCRDEGCTTLPDGTPIKSNTLKGELVAALEHHRSKKADAPAEPASSADEGASQPTEGDPTDMATEPAAPADPEPVAPAAEPEGAPIETVVENGETVQVDTGTGEVTPVEATPEEAIANVEEALGGTVIADTPVEEQAPAPASPATSLADQLVGKVCEDCGKGLENERVDIVRIAKIKHRALLCGDCHEKRKGN